MPLPSSLTIIGFGAFGQLAARVLQPHLRVSICDPAPSARAAAQAMDLPIVMAKGLAAQDAVLIAVPVPAFETCLRQIAPHLRAGQLVLDACSVKEAPARLMADLLPEGIDVLATHPMFGPASAELGLAGARIVLCPVRGMGWRRIAAFLRRAIGLHVLIASPETHDRQAALSQGLTHLLAQAFSQLGPRPEIRTRSYEMMVAALDLVRDDAPEVFAAVTKGNPHFAEMRQRLIAALSGEIPQKGERGTIGKDGSVIDPARGFTQSVGSISVVAG